HRVPPALRLPEQIKEALGLGGGVAAALRLDADLDPEHDGMDAHPGRLGNPQAEVERRRCRVGIRLDSQDVEDEFTHLPPSLSPAMPRGPRPTTALRLFRSSKKVAMVAQTSSPPAKPFQFMRTRAVSSYALDRKSTRLNSSHVKISYAVFCLK